MKKSIFIVVMLFLSAQAQAKIPLDFELAKKAIDLASTVDAYGSYCDKPTTLTDEFIKKFNESKLSEEKDSLLKSIKKQSFDQTLEKLKSEKKACKDVNFLLKKLEIMRSLKDVSYQLNGVDPATVKDNIPPLEMMAPEGHALTPDDVQDEQIDKKEK